MPKRLMMIRMEKILDKLTDLANVTIFADDSLMLATVKVAGKLGLIVWCS